MTHKSPSIARRWPEAEALINQNTAKKFNISDGEVVTLITRRGKYKVRIHITDDVVDDVVAVPWHWGANILTNDALDPEAMTPEAKVCACKIVKEV